MSRTQKEYQEFVTKKIHVLKSKSYGSFVLHGKVGDQTFDIIFLTAEKENDTAIISLLSKWRKKHEMWFTAQFPITNVRTKSWFKTLLIDKPDRLLFMIRVSDKYMGHVGLNRFNFKKRTCEIDNIVRGETGYPGLMEAAIKTMMAWGTRSLGVAGFSLLTTSDNSRAIALYTKLGFVTQKKVPLVYKKTSEGGEWVSTPRYKGNILRYDVYMKKQSKLLPNRK